MPIVLNVCRFKTSVTDRTSLTLNGKCVNRPLAFRVSPCEAFFYRRLLYHIDGHFIMVPFVQSSVRRTAEGPCSVCELNVTSVPREAFYRRLLDHIDGHFIIAPFVRYSVRRTAVVDVCTVSDPSRFSCRRSVTSQRVHE